jgi:hypothetical protein
LAWKKWWNCEIPRWQLNKTWRSRLGRLCKILKNVTLAKRPNFFRAIRVTTT